MSYYVRAKPLRMYCMFALSIWFWFSKPYCQLLRCMQFGVCLQNTIIVSNSDTAFHSLRAMFVQSLLALWLRTESKGKHKTIELSLEWTFRSKEYHKNNKRIAALISLLYKFICIELKDELIIHFVIKIYVFLLNLYFDFQIILVSMKSFCNQKMKVLKLYIFLKLIVQ